MHAENQYQETQDEITNRDVDKSFIGYPNV